MCKVVKCVMYRLLSAIKIFLILSFFSHAFASPQYAALVIDAKTGKTLYSQNADSPRYPASLTKMMTLYLTFEALERQKIKKSTPVFFSRYASSQSPMKLGIPPGGMITVQQAIQALVTKSANDASVALAELLSGSQKNFSRLMNKKAKSLGMKKTVFHNPNGLPDKRQITTARDMATLGIALRKHFPQYYNYFSVRCFHFRKRQLFNHNKLLGAIKGVDGIKTGYTQASGFNLVSSASDGKRRIVAVIMGEKTSKIRDNNMKKLIQTYMPMAVTYPKKEYQHNTAEALDWLNTTTPIALPEYSPIPYLKPQDYEKEIFTVEEKNIENIILKSIHAKNKYEELTVNAYREEKKSKSSSLDIIKDIIQEKIPKWVIQIGHAQTRQEAKKIITQSRQKITVLAQVSSSILPSQKKGKKFYHKIEFGDFFSKKSALRACSALKKNGLTCRVILKNSDDLLASG